MHVKSGNERGLKRFYLVKAVRKNGKPTNQKIGYIASISLRTLDNLNSANCLHALQARIDVFDFWTKALSKLRVACCEADSMSKKIEKHIAPVSYTEANEAEVQLAEIERKIGNATMEILKQEESLHVDEAMQCSNIKPTDWRSETRRLAVFDRLAECRSRVQVNATTRDGSTADSG